MEAWLLALKNNYYEQHTHREDNTHFWQQQEILI